jgi:replication factor A1
MSDTELVKIDSLGPYSRKVDTVVKVVSVGEARDVSGRGGDHRVSEVLVGDETGCIYLTLWDDTINQIEEENTLSITNGYVNLFKGNMRLNIGRYGSFEVLKESPISEVNTENNLSSKLYEQKRRYKPRYSERRGYQRRY